MHKLLADAGTSWTKVLELYDNSDELDSSAMNVLLNFEYVSTEMKITSDNQGNQLNCRKILLPTKLINKHEEIIFDAATGHMSKRRIKDSGKYENELIAMALGGLKLLKEDTVTLVDLGSRDSKWIKYKNRKYKDLDWNGSCGSGTGATIEMVCNFYDVDPKNLPIEREKVNVTCGVFGMEKIMDMIARGYSADIAISRYIHGIAFNVWNFAQCPDIIYLSGGLCLNDCFVNSLKLYCDVKTLGRFVLIEGLY